MSFQNSKHKSIIFVSPPCQGTNIRLGESLGIRYIMSFIREHNYHSDIVECDMNKLDTYKTAQKLIPYDIIGFSANFSGQYRSIRTIIDQLISLKSSLSLGNPIFVIGGHFATFQYEFILNDCRSIDIVVIGEGEETFLELLNSDFLNLDQISNIAFRSGHTNITVTTGLSRFSSNIDRYPFPYRDKDSYFLGQPHFSIISTRGCYAKCAFCSVNSFSAFLKGPKWRLRSPSNFVDEIEYLVNAYGIKVLSFLDSVFIGKDNVSKERARHICKLLKERQINIKFNIECRADTIDEDLLKLLMRHGLKNVFVGLESGSNKCLSYLKKGTTVSDNERAISVLRRLGLDVTIGFINFYPEMSYEDIAINIDFLFNNHILRSNMLSARLHIYYGSEYSYRLLPTVKVTDDGFDIKYEFIDKRIEAIYNEFKLLTNLLAPVEHKLDILAFNKDVFIEDLAIKAQINDTITKIKNKIMAKLYKVAKLLFIEVGNNHKISHELLSTIHKNMREMSKNILKGLAIWDNITSN